MTDNLLPLFKPAPKDELLIHIARAISGQIAAWTEITRRLLSAEMTKAFGATDSSGAWTMRDAFDAFGFDITQICWPVIRRSHLL